SPFSAVQRKAFRESPAAASRYASKYSSGDSSPERIRSAACATVSSISSLATISWPRSRLRRGDAEGPAGRIGSALEHLVSRPAGPRLVGPEHVLQGDHVGGRLDAVEVELGDVLDVLEDPRQLAGHPLDLLVVELQAGQPGD